MMTRKRKRGTGRILIRGQKIHIQFYNRRGEQVRESTGIYFRSPADLEKAEKKLRKRIGEVEAGVYRDVSRLSYESLRDSFLADYALNRRKSLRSKDGRPHLDKVRRLDDFFANYIASEIDTDLIRKFISGEQKKGLAHATINRSLSALRRMFNIARQDGKLRDVPYFPMLKEASPRQGFFEREQYDALACALPDYLRLPLAMGYFTAMRAGEILSLRWDQVDLLAGSINLLAGETKNDAARTVPIVPHLRALLVEQRGKRSPECLYVCFRFDRRGHAVRIGNFRKAWQSRCVKLGFGQLKPVLDANGEPVYERARTPSSKPKPKLRYAGPLFHDLRRSGVRNLVRAGVPERVAQQISGHRSRSVFERYNIVSANDLVEAGRRLASFHADKVGDSLGTIEVTISSSKSLPS